jgi:hypothetical protein
MMGDDAKFRMIPLTQVDTGSPVGRYSRHRNNDEIFNRRYISSLKLSSNYPDIDQFSYSRKFALLVVTEVVLPFFYADMRRSNMATTALVDHDFWKANEGNKDWRLPVTDLLVRVPTCTP